LEYRFRWICSNQYLHSLLSQGHPTLTANTEQTSRKTIRNKNPYLLFYPSLSRNYLYNEIKASKMAWDRSVTK
jgi:hypothetical protein